jgi:hypothetical protein
MPGELGHRYAAALRAKEMLTINGDRIQVLDVQCTLGDTLNVHLPHTSKILNLDGIHARIPGAGTVALADLCVTISRGGLPYIADRSGQRYLPVFLGGGYHDYLPTLAKFVCLFGPTELASVFPPPREITANGVTVGCRTLIGNVILHRDYWRVKTKDVRQLVNRQRDADAFMSFTRWRKQHNIPDRVFVMEKVSHPLLTQHYRPQYVDLTSPLFTPILQSVARSADDELLVFEMLPGIEAFPKDSAGKSWAVELLLDSFVLSDTPPSKHRDSQRSEHLCHEVS